MGCMCDLTTAVRSSGVADVLAHLGAAAAAAACPAYFFLHRIGSSNLTQGTAVAAWRSGFNRSLAVHEAVQQGHGVAPACQCMSKNETVCSAFLCVTLTNAWPDSADSMISDNRLVLYIWWVAWPWPWPDLHNTILAPPPSCHGRGPDSPSVRVTRLLVVPQPLLISLCIAVH